MLRLWKGKAGKGRKIKVTTHSWQGGEGKKKGGCKRKGGLVSKVIGN